MTRTGTGTTWAVARAAMAVLIATAVAAQAARTIGDAARASRDVAVTTANFFSFFTILSNVSAVVVLGWAAVWFLRNRTNARPEPHALALALASASTYMIVTGVVYNLLLRGIALPQGTTVAWSNEVLHLIGPLFLLADLVLGPRRRALAWRSVGVVLVFPIVWVGYTLLRGPITVNPVTGAPFWYPYPFLDPNGPAGYPGVIGYVVGIAVTIIVFALAVIGVGRRRGSTAGADRGRR